MTRWIYALLAVAVLVVSSPAVACAGNTVNVKLTFYGYPDNDPPNSNRIHHPGPPPRHSAAGGAGTYDNPTTVAGGRWAPGTRLYLPYLSKYLIVEDSCAGCSGNHIDVWVGGRGSDKGAVLACQRSLTPGTTVPVEVDPPPGRYVRAGGLC